MYISSLALRNFRCFGEEPTVISLENDITCFVGNNGSGKTSIFLALKRLFGENREDRTIVKEDFHLAPNENFQDIEGKELYVEVVFSFPELNGDSSLINKTCPAFESYIYFDNENQIMKARMRLEAKWNNSEYEDDVESSLYWITSPNDIDFGKDYEFKSTVSNFDRKIVKLRYIPAFRDSSAILKNNLKSLMKIISECSDLQDDDINAIESSSQELGEKIETLDSIETIKTIIDENWAKAHDNTLKHYQKAKLQVAPTDINQLLKSISLKLEPAENGDYRNIEELSDGQISLLYFTLSIVLYDLEQKHYAGKVNGFKPCDIIPATFTIFAIEEPENHLSPFYMGRILNLLFEKLNSNAIGILSSHSASVVRRLKKIEQIRHFRQEIDENNRITVVKTIKLPENKQDEDYKYINQAVLAHPEIYFSKLVLLGEGDSEEIIIPQIASKLGFDLDPSFVAFVKLGGRHVNHMWRLLNELNIPHVTLLDFDLGRNEGGLCRVKYIINELRKIGIGFICPDGTSRKELNDETLDKDQILGVLEKLENYNVFYSRPLDLDMSMIRAFPEVYEDNANNARRNILEKAVLGESGDYSKYENLKIEISEQELKKYRYLFCSKSKVIAHYKAINEIIIKKKSIIESKCPQPLKNLIYKCNEITRRYINNEE